MCLLIFSHQPDTELPLVIAANRDEFHARPTAASHFWEDAPGVLAGRDLQGGGTWMGVTRSGRFAAITNYRDPNASGQAPRSRGELTLDYLRGDQAPEDYLHYIEGRGLEYAGFNLLVGDLNTLWYLSNSGPPTIRGPLRLEPGLYGLSNASLDTPWPKVKLGKQAMAGLLDTQALSHSSLAATVNSTALADPEELHLQNLTAEMDEQLSAQFISAGPYGTRACTTLWLQQNGEIHWQERSFNQAGEETARVSERFVVAAAG